MSNRACRALSVLLIGLLLGLTASCSNTARKGTVQFDESNTGTTKAVWEYKTDNEFSKETFFDYPWPEMQRRDSDGTLAMKGFPNPAPEDHDCKLNAGNVILKELLLAIEPHVYRQHVIDFVDRFVSGFGNNAGIFFRFSGLLDAKLLPTPADTLKAGATVFLINVDKSSDRRGERIPVSLEFYTESRYLPANTLALLPYPGFPLAANSLYAAVIRRTVKDSSGKHLTTSENFEALKLKPGSDASEQHKTYAEVFDYLESEQNIDRSSIGVMSVYRTQDPTALLRKLSPEIEKLDPALGRISVDNVTVSEKNGYYKVEGTFRTPIYQKNNPPYLPRIEIKPIDLSKSTIFFELDNRDGEILTGDVQDSDTPDLNKPRMESIPFVLTVPVNVVADGGQDNVRTLPLALYSHGTGGNRNTVLGTEARNLAQLGIASFAIDQVMHEGRVHMENLQPELQEKLGAVLPLLEDAIASGVFFFNPLNLHAARGNVIQSGIDYIWQAHLLSSVKTSLTVDFPIVGGTVTRTLKFDSKNIFFFGHSQGGLTGPLTSLSTKIRALTLSAAGGHLISSLLTKTKPAAPLNIPDTFKYLVCDTNLTQHHPFMSAVMTYFEPGDPVNYAPLINVFPGDFGAKHLFLTHGTEDNYAPLPTLQAISLAARTTQVAPNLTDAITEKLLGLPLVNIDLMGNRLWNGIKITSGHKEYHGEKCSDDHFVYTCVDRAETDWVDFFDSLLNQPTPIIRTGN